MKLVKAADLYQEAKYARLLVFGEPGTGKTWFGASAALDEATAPCLFLEYRAQAASLRSNPKYRKALEDGSLILIRLKEYRELNKVYHWLKNGRGSQRDLDAVMESYSHPADQMPKTVIVDSLTELQRSEVMRRAGNTEGKFLTDVEAPQIQHWGQLLNQFTLLAHLFYQLPIHVMFVGLEDVQYGKRVVGQEAPITGYRLALQGQAKRQFPAYALTVMRLERAPKGAKEFNRGITSSSVSRTKEQTGYLPAIIPNPTLPKIAKLLGGEDVK